MVQVAMHIALIAKPGHVDSGVGRYSSELERQILALGHDVTVVHPIVPFPSWFVRVVHRCLGWNLNEFFENYATWACYPKADIYHITSQNLAMLLWFCRPPGKTVITVHDIIPWLVRNDPVLRVYPTRMHAWFDWLSMKAISRADQVVTDSFYSTDSLDDIVDLLGLTATTIHLGIS